MQVRVVVHASQQARKFKCKVLPLCWTVSGETLGIGVNAAVANA